MTPSSWAKCLAMQDDASCSLAYSVLHCPQEYLMVWVNILHLKQISQPNTILSILIHHNLSVNLTYLTFILERM